MNSDCKYEENGIIWNKCGECKNDYDSREDNIGLREGICYKCSVNGMKTKLKFIFMKKCGECKEDYDSREENLGLRKNTCKRCNMKRMQKPRLMNVTCSCGDCKEDYDLREDNIGLKEGICKLCGIKRLKDIGCKAGEKTRCKDLGCEKCFKKSFASHEKAKFWNSLRNGDVSPRNIALGCHLKYWFRCGECNHDLYLMPSVINRGRWCITCSNQSRCGDLDCRLCFEHSFASHENAKFWHPLGNANRPRNVALHSGKKYWLECGECGHEFSTSPEIVNKGCRCGFCDNKLRCEDPNCQLCFKHSFASHEKAKFWHPTKNEDIKPRNIALNDNDKYWFKCGECKHEFDLGPNKINADHWCDFCANLARCEDLDCQFCFKHSFASNEKAQFWHPTKNGDIKPRSVALNSAKKYWFVCAENGHEFPASPSDINSGGRWCNICRNKTEAKLNVFLNENVGGIEYQVYVEWCKNFETSRYFPFDFRIECYKIIIELDGDQHFRDIKSRNSLAKNIQDRDKYKMRRAIENGYSIIRISQEDVWRDTYDWQNDLLQAIEKCKNEAQVVFCSKNRDLYVNHKQIFHDPDIL
jgi:very-short-patch-repair endonuclease